MVRELHGSEFLLHLKSMQNIPEVPELSSSTLEKTRRKLRHSWSCVPIIIMGCSVRLTSQSTLPMQSPLTSRLANSKDRYCLLLSLNTHWNSSASLGVIDASTVLKVVKEVTAEEKQRQLALAARPPVENILNLHDFEVRLVVYVLFQRMQTSST